MESKDKLPMIAYFMMMLLDWHDLKLAVHYDPQGQGHLTVIRHDPNEKQQMCYFLYPGEQYDLTDPCPEVSREFITLIDSEHLWKKINFKKDFYWILHKAIHRLLKAEGTYSKSDKELWKMVAIEVQALVLDSDSLES